MSFRPCGFNKLPVTEGARDAQKMNGLQIQPTDVKRKGSGYDSEGKHLHTPAFT